MEITSSPDLPSLMLSDEIFDKITCDSPRQEQLSTSVTERLQQIIIRFHESATNSDSIVIWELEPDTFLIKFESEPVAPFFAKCTLAQAETLQPLQIPFIPFIVDDNSFLDLELLRINNFFAKFPDASPIFLEVVPTPPSLKPLVPCAHITHKRLAKLLLNFAPLLPQATRHTLHGYHMLLCKQYPDQASSQSSPRQQGNSYLSFFNST